MKTLLRKKKKTALGLDLGASKVTAVVLKLDEDRISVAGSGILNLSDQGVLNDSEYCHAVRVWLEENKWQGLDAFAALPQYLATVNVKDFPASVASRHVLTSMIDYETQHLSGISEETFINDYHVMPPRFGRVNPVLIGICKESVINEKVEIAENIGINLGSLSIDSIAAANAFFSLNPDAVNDNRPKLLLDISEQGSAMGIIAGAQILYAGSLIGNKASIGREVQRAGEFLPPSPEDEKEPLRLARRPVRDMPSRQTDSFAAEILNAIDHWHELETPEMKSSLVSSVLLCGEGAAIEGMQDYLSKALSCPVSPLGPRTKDLENVRPELAVAYGMAITGLGKQQISISMCPQVIQWANRRKANFAFLAASAALMIFALAAILLGKYLALSISDSRNREAIIKLSRCDNLIPQLEETLDRIDHHQKMMIPFVVKGNNANRLVSAFKEFAKITPSDSYFFIYIADGETFKEGATTTSGRTSRPGLKASFFDSDAPAVIAGRPADLQPVNTMREISDIILMGYSVCQTNNEHFAILRKIQDTLNESSTFGKGDILPDEQSIERADIVERWERQVVNNRNVRDQLQLRRNRFRPFAINMPFKEQSYKMQETRK